MSFTIGSTTRLAVSGTSPIILDKSIVYSEKVEINVKILEEREEWPLRNTDFSAKFDSLPSKAKVWVQLHYH